MNDFPQRMKDARNRLSLNQKQLADRAGFNPTTISHFETGTRKPSFDNLKRLSNALLVTADYLLGNANPLSTIQWEVRTGQGTDPPGGEEWEPFAAVCDPYRGIRVMWRRMR